MHGNKGRNLSQTTVTCHPLPTLPKALPNPIQKHSILRTLKIEHTSISRSEKENNCELWQGFDEYVHGEGDRVEEWGDEAEVG